MSDEIVIYGAGGFGREVRWLLREIHEATGAFKPIAYIDERDVEGLDLPVLRPRSIPPKARMLIAVGDPEARRDIAVRCRSCRPAAAVNAIGAVCGEVKAGRGSIVCAGSILTVNVRLGRHVHVNLACTIGHDVRLGDYVTLSPGVHVSGGVTLDEGVFVGTGAVILPGVWVGAWAKVGAGAVVLEDVPAGQTVVGVPARPVDREAAAAVG